MLERLLAIFNKLEYEEFGWTQVLGFDRDGRECRVQLLITPGGRGVKQERWTIHCREPLDFGLRGSGMRTRDYLRLHGAPHVLLAPYTEPHGTLSFRGSPANAAATAYELQECARSIAGEFGGVVRLGRAVPLDRFLAVGYGVVAEGPVSWLRQYERVLARAGLRTSLLDVAGPPGVPGARALTLGASFVVASHFDAVPLPA